MRKYVYGNVQQKRATERARCLFRVKGALFNSLIIVCCVFEKENQAPISIDFFLLFSMVPLFLLRNAFFRTKTRVEYWKPFFSKYIKTYIDRFFPALSNGAIIFIRKCFLLVENSIWMFNLYFFNKISVFSSKWIIFFKSTSLKL